MAIRAQNLYKWFSLKVRRNQVRRFCVWVKTRSLENSEYNMERLWQPIDGKPTQIGTQNTIEMHIPIKCICISESHFTFRICHTRFRHSHGENLLIWEQNSAFLSRYRVRVSIKYFLCSKAIKMILSLSIIWVFLCTHYVNEETKYDWIKTTQMKNDFLYVGFKVGWISVCLVYPFVARKYLSGCTLRCALINGFVQIPICLFFPATHFTQLVDLLLLSSLQLL